MSTKKLKVQVLAGRKLAGKNNGKSDPYCEVVVLDDQGNKIGKAQVTKVIKGDLNPAWNQLLEFSVPSTFSGLKVRCWDKHRFRSDKFLGQVTIKFNTALLQSSEKLDDWFTLNKRKSDEEVSGDVHLQIIYGDLKADTTASPVTKTERSSTLVGETPQLEVRVSAAFNSAETDKKLQTSTHTVVAEDEEPTDSSSKEDATDYEKVRDGPSAAALDVFVKGDKDLAFTNKNLEVTSNSSDYYKLSYAKGNVAVNGGKWYYEVRIQISGQMQLGWASTSYNPKTNTGDIWTFDGSRQQKLKNGSGTVYGEYWTNGDIIGVGLDLESKTIQYWRNGKDLGAAFTDVTCGGARLVPVFGIIKRAKISVNFGKDTFAFPQSSLNMLHCFLSEKEIDQLSKLFIKYKEISNEENEGGEPKDSIHGQGVLTFQKNLGASDDEDPTLLLLAWKLKCETLWEISREEFMNGFTVYGCAAMDKIKYKIGEWKDELKDNTQFRNFYNFVFDYLKEDKKILLTEDAIAAWKIVLKDGRKWGLFNDFVEFLNAENKKSISRDAWQQLWHFMNSYPTSLKDYDVNSSWPIIYDEFVDWMEAQGRKNR